MKKFLLALVLIMTGVFAFAGCSLVTLDNDKYLATEIARVGDEVITREDYITEYNRIYLSYYQSYSSYMSYITIGGEKLVDKLPEMALDNLINIKIMYIEGVKQHGELSADELNYIIVKTYENFDSFMDSYAKDYVEKLELKENEEQAAPDKPAVVDYKDTSSKNKIEFYEKLAKVVQEGGVYSVTNLTGINLSDEVLEAKATYVYGTDKTSVDYVNYYFDNYTYDTDEDKMADAKNEARLKFLAYLRKNEQNKEFEDKSNTAILTRQFDKMFDANKEAYYVELMQSRIENDTVITASDIAKEYANLIHKNHQKYALDITNYTKDIQSTSNAKNVLYFMDDDTDYYKVSHLLISFDSRKNDDTNYGKYVSAFQTEFSKIYKQYLADNSEENTAAVEIMKNSFMIVLEDDTLDLLEDNAELAALVTINDEIVFGENEDEKITVSNIKAITMLDFWKLLDGAINAKTTTGEKMRVFAEFMNLYSNDDDGIMKTDSTNNYYVYHKDSSYVYEFKNAIDNMITMDANIGDIGGLNVGYRSDDTYGIHIVMWLGKCENAFNNVAEYDKSENYDDLIEYLDNNYYNYMSGETMFDYVYSNLHTRLINNAETDCINSLREEIGITINEAEKNKTIKK